MMVNDLECQAFWSVKNKRTISGANAMRIRHHSGGGCLTPWLLLFLLAASSSNADNLGESFLLSFSGGGRPLIIIVGFDDRLVVLSRYRPAQNGLFFL